MLGRKNGTKEEIATGRARDCSREIDSKEECL